MSGALATDELRVLRSQIGADAYTKVLASLGEAAQAELRALTAVSWIDVEHIKVEHIKAVFLAAARETGRRPEQVHRDAVRGGIEHTFRSVWRLLLRVTTDNALVTRTPAFYARSYDTGALTARIVSPGRADLLLDGWPNGGEYSMRGVGIAVEATLTLAGRTGVQVSFYRTATGAKYLATWDT
jgi:hypothetical protein